MPKGFTQEMLQYIGNIATAAMNGDMEASSSAGDGLYNALRTDQQQAERQGVPAEFYMDAQGAEITRALKDGFPTKNIGIQYAVERAAATGKPGEALALIGDEPNLLQRAALYDAIGRSDLAGDAALEGIKELLESVPGKYQVAGKASR